jgi:ATP-dependent protease Clp ATPase subunit
MVDMMYQLPDEPRGAEYTITEKIVEGKADLFSTKKQKKKESA